MQQIHEILCGRLPANLQSPELRRTVAFYRDQWGFDLARYVPGVIASLTWGNLTVQLWQRRADMPAALHACRVLVDALEPSMLALQSAPGQPAQVLVDRSWGLEFGLSDCDGNRLLLVQSAPHAARRRART